MGLPEESPSSPGLLGQHDGLSPPPGLMGPPDAPTAPMADEPPLPPTLPISNTDEVEPSAEVFPPTPAAGQVLDPATAERFQVPQQEIFEQRRARVDRQETLSFGPRRSQFQSSHGATPYDRPARGDDDAAANMAFNVEDMEQDSLPGDWCFKPGTGYFELREGARVRDFWELKAGCLLRHHCHQRRTLFDPAGSSDIPVPLDKLDNVRVTIHFDRDGSATTFTDDFRNPQQHDKNLRQHQLPSTWKGTVFQINAETRKELNMFSSDSNHCYHVQNAKKVAQGLKNQHQRQQRRDVTKMAKNKGEVLPNEALQILGATANTRMFLRKPVYGQLDAPRRWFLEAVRRLKSLGWQQHALDPCCFCLYDFKKESSPTLVGMLCLHTLEYCGVKLERHDHCWKVNQHDYIQKVKPVTIHKGRVAENEMNDHDRSQLRALLGSLQWPAVQTAPHLQCSASLISGQQKTGKLRAVIEANQLLRFAKQNSDVKLTYEPLEIDSLADLRLCAMFDAAHGVREDATSQGGYLIFVAPKKIFEEETSYHLIEWRSFKLPRVARSSLSAEAQAFGQAADMVEFICRYWICLFSLPSKLKECLDQRSDLEPVMITDAKALYDSYNKEGLTGSSSVDKRTSLEIRVGKEQLQALGGVLKWMSSEKQFADGLTKSSTRTLLADRLRHHRQKLVWDPNYTSAKRKDASEREASRNEFAKGKESNQQQPHFQPLTSPSPTSQPQHERMDDPAELYTMEDEDMNEETYEPAYDDVHVEPYEPVEAYVATPKNAKVIKYVIAALTWLPTTSAMHAAPDHEHGQSGIWFFAILEADLIRRLPCQCYDVAGRRNEVAIELEATRRNANVMAIMLASQIEAIRFLQARTDRLRSLIANHQAPCPLGDTVRCSRRWMVRCGTSTLSAQSSP
ncbi:unnamed protein product [Cladocopium goreaui]|uniref:Retrovirus-related Pol polyprotein from transposon RE2 (Retro element 2) (AtRE2) n=1 Tax=Cladocopium goreaui TaxID=2562237 RepID=A0A9P1GAC9_9DINO|nr:unnamed protein product [Cladocopium goreaui]